MNETIDNLRKQLANDETLQMIDAVDTLLNLAARFPSLHMEVIVQRSRFIRNERALRLGTITREEGVVEKNRINHALLQLLDEVSAKLTAEQAPVPPPSYSGETLSKLESSLLAGESARFEKILGINNLKQISWIARGLACARSVCRVLTPNGVGSGFLVAPNLLMTNNHVIASRQIAEGTRIEFNYQQDSSGGYEKTCRYRLDGARFHTSDIDQLDYTMVGVQPDPNNPPLASWGHLSLNSHANPVQYEHVSIIQHPNGGLKQIAMTANQVVSIQGHYLRYMTDSMPGSSGSPVFNDIWQVIAIHHAAAADGKSNEGILMSHLRPDAQAAGIWPAD